MPRRAKKIPDSEQFRKILKDKGIKVTPQRVAVHEAMLALGHAGADEVLDYIQDRLGEVCISQASVYNVLSKMADLGIYNRVCSSDNKLFFDVNTGRHVHLFDTRNGEFKDIADDGLCALVENYLKGKSFRGYKLDRYEVQLICHLSRKRKKQA